MKKRNREINIFSLSLMDVITGAMGAFLIIMIILSQSYQTDPATTKNVSELKEDLDEALKELKETKRLLSDRNVTEKIKKAEREIQEAKKEAREVEENLRQSKKRIENLENQTTEQKRELSYHKPFIVYGQWRYCNVDVDLYVESFAVSTKTNKKEMPPLNPYEQQWAYWQGDVYLDRTDQPGPDYWLVSQAVHNVDYKIYYKISGLPTRCQMNGKIYSDYFGNIDLPDLELTQERSWVLAGILNIDDEGKATFREPSKEEREADYQAILKRVGENPELKKQREEEQKRKEEAAQKEEKEREETEKRRKEFEALPPEKRQELMLKKLEERYGKDSDIYKEVLKSMEKGPR